MVVAVASLIRENLRLMIYTLLIFVAIIAAGEIVGRSLIAVGVLDEVNPLGDSGYSPAIGHLPRLRDYVNANGTPDCVFFGSSLTQTGINPVVFAEAFEGVTQEPIRCYNHGMDASSMSSSATMALLVAQTYHPTYLIFGVEAGRFYKILDDNPAHLAEDRLPNYSWIRYKLGEPNVSAWMQENSAFQAAASKTMRTLFPQQSSRIAEARNTDRIRPEVPRIINESGFAPLPGYRDASPIFRPIQDVYGQGEVDPKDFAALDDLIKYTSENGIKVLLVETPIPGMAMRALEVMDLVREHVILQAVPFLSTRELDTMPASAYSDSHMHVSGSYMFSEWLGQHFGHIVQEDVWTDLDNPIWTPELDAWELTYFETLGLSDESYDGYLSYLDNRSRTPEADVLFNPSDDPIDQAFLQSLIGFEIDWRRGVTNEQRPDLFELMTVLGEMKYWSDLEPGEDEQAMLDEWYDTLDPVLLQTLGIDRVICREERADSLVYCPDGIDEHPAYVLQEQWDFTPLYERYRLYNIVAQGGDAS